MKKTAITLVILSIIGISIFQFIHNQKNHRTNKVIDTRAVNNRAFSCFFCKHKFEK